MAKKLIYAYPTFEVRSLSYERSGERFNVYTGATLSPLPFHRSKIWEMRSKTPFRVVTASLPSAEFLAVLRELPSGVFRIGGRTALLATPSDPTTPNQPPRRDVWWHLWSDRPTGELWDGRATSEEAMPGYHLEGGSGQIQHLVLEGAWREMDQELLRQRPPVHGTPDLFNRVLRSDQNFSTGHNTKFFVGWPFDCHVHSPTMVAPGVVRLKVRAPALLSSRHLKGSGLLVAPSGTSRSVLAKLGAPSRASRLGLADFPATVRCGDASSLVFHVVLNDRIVARAAYDLPSSKSANPRMRILRTLDKALQQIDRVFASPEEGGKDAESFEIAVANLFAVSGFVVLDAGRKASRAGEAVDVVAVHPLAPIAFCIECTWKIANERSKLAKLVKRTREVRRALGEFTVKPVLVVAQPDLASDETSEASQLGITVLTLSHLRTIIQMADWNHGPSEVARWLNGDQPIRS